MKISNETKVGVLTISALTLLILGFNYLKGKELFKKNRKIYAVFGDLGGLSTSNEVKINGYVIGTVYKIEKKDKDLKEIVATINLKEDVNIPKDSRAVITSPLVGSYFINIQKGKEKIYLTPGDTLKSDVDKGILDDVKAQLTPTLDKVRLTLDSLNSVFNSINGILNAQARENLTQSLMNINRATSSLNNLLNSSTGPLARTLNNAEQMTASLRGNTDNINATINNAKITSEKLAKLDLKPTIDSLNAFVKQLKSISSRLDSKDGTIGALLNDRSLYNQINQAILSFEILADDMRANPKRYVNLSIFGRKDRSGPITSPLRKDTIRIGVNDK